jgi:hypothetical protein
MKKLIGLLALMGVVMLHTPAHAQLGKLKDKLERKAAEAIGGKLGKKKAEGASEEADSTAQEPAQGPGIDLSGILKGMGGMQPATIRGVYEFQADMKMQVASYKKGESAASQTVQYQYLLRHDGAYLGAEVPVESNGTKSQMIIDGGQMITVAGTGDSRMALVMALDPGKAVPAEGEEEKAPSFTKTGRTKTILGYTCEEYVSEDEESRMEIWIAHELQEESKSLLQPFLSSRGSVPGAWQSSPHELGFALEMIMHDKEKGERMDMQVIELRLDHPSRIDLSGVQAITAPKTQE